ncbi:PREDICTED: protein IFH1-like [Nicotiana attenuata]|uniref:protein IFH1-like n=1 Tax=Nicotiana attenuata TaxID=49451 RepID=UPI000904C5F9|nr:PREDICTED: protein IFH1-like [Nicotiana attenuata]
MGRKIGAYVYSRYYRSGNWTHLPLSPKDDDFFRKKVFSIQLMRKVKFTSLKLWKLRLLMKPCSALFSSKLVDNPLVHYGRDDGDEALDYDVGVAVEFEENEDEEEDEESEFDDEKEDDVVLEADGSGAMQMGSDIEEDEMQEHSDNATKSLDVDDSSTSITVLPVTSIQKKNPPCLLNQNPAEIALVNDEKYIRSAEDQNNRNKSSSREKSGAVHLNGRKQQRRKERPGRLPLEC